MLVKSSLGLHKCAVLHNMMLYFSSDSNINFPQTFTEILATVKRQQEAWEIVKLEIRNNLMDKNLL